MTATRLRTLRLVALAVAALAVLLFVALPLTRPRPGTLLVMVSARAPETLTGRALSVHGPAGWVELGSVSGLVPAAPETRPAAQAALPPAAYDRLRLGPDEVRVQLSISSGLVEPVLLGIEGGRLPATGVYAGNDEVNLGLAELGGQKTPMATFALTDQRGQPFTHETVAGRALVLAAFHTTCRETCPLYTGLFLQLSRRLPAGVLLAEVTNDVQDTPSVLLAYGERVGAGWTLATGTAEALAEFWRPFGVGLADQDQHVSTLVLVDAHGYVRLVYRGVPDLGGVLPAPLLSQLNAAGLAQLRRGEGWGAPQVLEAVRTISGNQPPPATAGGPVPVFSARTLEGQPVSLADFSRQPLVVNFWATYCPPCQTELPLLQSGTQRAGVRLLLIDVRDEPGAARATLRQLRVRAPSVADTAGQVTSMYGVLALPTTFFLRADGSLEGRQLGALDERTLSAHLAALSGG